MLITPSFDLEKLNEKYKDRGVNFTAEKETMYNKNGLYVKGTCIKDHEFWKNSRKSDEEICVFRIFIEDAGIVWGWDVDNDINHFSNLKLDSFSNFDLITGISYNNDDYRHIIFQYEGNLPSNKPKPTSINLVSSYGVSDNVEQVLEYYKNVINNPNEEVVISFFKINKCDEPVTGGWRWHKWGQYIGTKNPQHEYLYDEQDIDVVYIFQINVVKEKV